MLKPKSQSEAEAFVNFAEIIERILVGRNLAGISKRKD